MTPRPEPLDEAERDAAEVTRWEEGRAEQSLSVAVSPKQTLEVEALSQAAMAYAREQDDYELFMSAWRVYLTARRKTTALIQAERDANMYVSELPSFTEMQWSRRMKELAIEQERIDSYFDELVQNGWQPSMNGLLRYSEGRELDRFALAKTAIVRNAKELLKGKLSRAQKNTCEDVLTVFGEDEK